MTAIPRLCPSRNSQVRWASCVRAAGEKRIGIAETLCSKEMHGLPYRMPGTASSTSNRQALLLLQMQLWRHPLHLLLHLRSSPSLTLP